MKKTLNTLIKRILIILLSLTLLLVSIAGITVIVAYSKLPSLETIANCQAKTQPLNQMSIGDFNEQRTACTEIEAFPLNLKNAVLVAEDSRFYERRGIDPSTISQQISRSLTFLSKGSLRRHFDHALLIYKIELNFSKDEILTFYLNHVNLGQNAFGFPAASRIYFGKPVSELTLAESAMLAGLPKAPSALNPITNPDRAKTRQESILAKMKEAGLITQAQLEQAKRQVLVYQVSHIRR